MFTSVFSLICRRQGGIDSCCCYSTFSSESLRYELVSAPSGYRPENTVDNSPAAANAVVVDRRDTSSQSQDDDHHQSTHKATLRKIPLRRKPNRQAFLRGTFGVHVCSSEHTIYSIQAREFFLRFVLANASHPSQLLTQHKRITITQPEFQHSCNSILLFPSLFLRPEKCRDPPDLWSTTLVAGL